VPERILDAPEILDDYCEYIHLGLAFRVNTSTSDITKSSGLCMVPHYKSVL
jgi:hypothetical protein